MLNKLSSLEIIKKYIKITRKYQSKVRRNLFDMFSLLSTSRKSYKSCLRYVVCKGPITGCFYKSFKTLLLFWSHSDSSAVTSTINNFCIRSRTEQEDFWNLNQSLVEFSIVPFSFPPSPILLKKMKLQHPFLRKVHLY